jgi:Flp pilus assembly protein TadD
MIGIIIVVAAVVVILILIARRLPDARAKMFQSREVSDQEISLYGLIAQADEAFEEKKFTQAENLYVKAAAQDPDNPKIYSRLGAIYLEQKNFYDARDAFLQAVKLEPDLASRHINLGLAYMGLKDYYKAGESFKKALNLDPKNKKYARLLERAKKAQEKEKKKTK